MNLKAPKKHEILLFPSFSALMTVAAFQMVQGYPLAQVLLVLLAISDTVGGLAVLNYIYQPKEKEAEQPAPELEPAPSGFQRVHKVIPNLNQPAINTYQSVTLNVQQQDLRWRHFAYAIVTHNTPMTQSKWTGKNRPFSKPEFEYQMQGWLKDGVVAPKNRKGNTGGFKPNGAGGWQYFTDLANGKRWIALPHQD